MEFSFAGIKKMTVFIVEDDPGFNRIQQHFSDSPHPLALIHTGKKTFTLQGPLAEVPLAAFMQLCLDTLLCIQQPDTACCEPQPPLYLASKTRELVDKTCQYIRQHLDHPLTLESISKAMNTNRNSLAKAFRQELNCGVSGWLRAQRMEKARQLLRETNLSMQEISIRLGYMSQANFSVAFKQHYKQSPLRSRRKKD